MIAVKAHAGQIDKAGHPYILHPLRMMINARTEKEKITALLHDVIEDSTITLEALRKEGFTEDVLVALRFLARGSSIHYEKYLENLATNTLARKVKLLDLNDNMDIKRIENPQTEDIVRWQKYQKAYAYLIQIENEEKELA